jgi:hypothetical protein
MLYDLSVFSYFSCLFFYSNVAWGRSRRLPLHAAGGGGLTEALLVHCAGDAHSPFVREWAIYGARQRQRQRKRE